jgi:hypothetical protein
MRNQSRMVCLILSVSSPEIRSASQRNRYPGRMRRIKMSAMAQSGHLGAADNCPLLGAKRTLRGPVSTRINYRVKESRRVLRERWDKADRAIDQQTGRWAPLKS